MAIATTDKSSLDAHLAEVGVKSGMSLVVHSSLVSFGRIEGGAATVYEALRRAVGDQGTVAVPTYTFHISPKDIFDPSTTASRGFGALSEWVRQIPGALRGTCPIHGYAAIGPDAETVANADETKSFGKGSAFDAMHGAGFHLLLLGCSFQQGGTFVHHVETEVGVPYREWLKLPRQIAEHDGGVRHIEVDYYARKDGTPWQPHLHGLQDVMIGQSRATSARAAYGQSYLMKLDPLYVCAEAMLRENPYAFVTRDPAPSD
jgi:aminoglycoside 3-N-acetyltransferase